MKPRFLTLTLAPLLIAGSMATASAPPTGAPTAPVADDLEAAIFAPASPSCPEAQNHSEPVLTDTGGPSCGMCSAPACQGASWTAYCGVTPNQQKKYCQPTQMCTGEGIGKFRCLCVVGGDIIP